MPAPGKAIKPSMNIFWQDRVWTDFLFEIESGHRVGLQVLLCMNIHSRSLVAYAGAPTGQEAVVLLGTRTIADL